MRAVVCLAAACLGAGLAFLGRLIINAVPAKWLCDYGEEPSKALLNRERLTLKRTVPLAAALAVGAAGAAFVYGLTLYSVLLALIFSVLLMIAWSDWKYTIIPDQFTAALALLCLAGAYCDLCTGQWFIRAWYSPPLGAVCGFLLFFLIDLICRAVLKKDGFGFGDVKLFSALGALFGFPMIFTAFIFAVFTAFFHIIVLFLTKKAKNGAYLPMGPYICIGTALLLLLRGPVFTALRMYLNLIGI